MSEQELEMLRKAGETASNTSVPAWVSVLVFATFLTWAVWYLTRKLNQVNRRQTNVTSLERLLRSN